jgi:hypothetical protein
VARKRLLECSFLIPVRRDSKLSDGGPHRRREWTWLEKELVALGGVTQATGLYAGWYVDPDTRKPVKDLSRKFFVALPREEITRLRSLLREACGVFQQKCIYLSVAGHVEFVERPRDETR